MKKERDLMDIVREAQEDLRSPTSVGTKKLDIPPRLNGDLAEPGPYEPVIVEGQYRCDCCGQYFDPDEGEWVDGQFRCHKDKEELEVVEREEKKSKCFP